MATTSLTFDLFAKDYASPTFSRFGGSVSRTTSTVGALRSSLGLLAKSFVGLYAIQKVTQFLGDSVTQARESNKVSAQTQAVLKSTGRAANLTADDIGNLADKISLKTGIDDEAIQTGENLLLTFRNVRDEVGKGNDVFTRATKITNDMSVALDQSLKSSTIQVGKALNDPIKGLTALSRVGVTFSKGQTKRITDFVNEGHAMKAQKVILRELNNEFKGSAKAQADPADKAKVAWENFQEEVGKKLLPVLDRLLVWFVKDGLPAIERFGGFLGKTLGPVVSQVAGWFSGAGDSGGRLSTAFAGLVSAGKNLYEALKPIAVDIFESVKRNWPQIQATISGIVDQISGIVTDFTTLVTTVWEKWGDDIMRVVGRVFGIAMQIVKTSLHTIHGVIQIVTGIIQGDWGKVWDGVKEILKGAWDLIKTVVKNGLSTLKELVGELGGKLKELMGKAWDKAKDAALTGIGKVVHWAGTLPAKIVRAIGDLAHLLFQAGVDVIQGLLDGITSKIDDVKDLAGKVGDSVKDGFNSALTILSPSKVMHKSGENAMQGLIDGITSKIQNLKSLMASVASTVSGLFGNPLSGENVNTTADIFRQQKAEIGSATQLRNDIKKLLHKGLDMRFIQQLVESGNLTALHALATDSRADVQRFERGQRRLGQVTGRVTGNLNADSQARVEELQAERRRDRELLKGLKQAFKEGMDGARIVIDAQGHARLLIRQGG